jgi:hypothetical protein
MFKMDEKTLKEAFASLVKKGDMSAVAALLVEYVGVNHIPTDFTGLLLTSRSLNVGDALD